MGLLKNNIKYWAIFVSLTLILALCGIGRSRSEASYEVYRKAIYLIPEKLNPATSLTTSEHSISNLLYNGLFSIDENMNIVEDIVDSWKVDESGKIYNLKIKNNITFSNGSKLTSDDILKNFKTIISEKNIVSGNFQIIDRIEVLSKTRIRFFLKSAYPPFLSLLASPTAKIYKDVKNSRYPIGTGNFILDSFGVENGKKVLKFKKSNKAMYIPFEMMELWEMDEKDALKSISKGEIHDTSIYISKSNLFIKNSRVKETKTAAAQTWLISFNMKKKPTNDIRFRSCFSSLFKKEDFVKKFFPDHKIATTYLPPGLLGSKIDNNLISTVLDQKYRTKNIDCTEFLDIQVTIDYPKELAQWKETCYYLENMDFKGHFKLKCNAIGFSQLVERIKLGESMLSFLGMSLDLPDTEYFLNTFDSKSTFNLSNYENEFIDRKMTESRLTNDRIKRGEIYSNINLYLLKEIVTLNISYPKHISYRHSCIESIPIGLGGDIYIDYTLLKLKNDCPFKKDFDY